MNYVWFWTFWHWSVEAVRSGALLRGPVHGIGSHWDEWYRFEASASDREAVARVGEGERSQRAFVVWLVRCWTREARWRGEGPHARFVLTQLAQRAPFSGWPAFAPFREVRARRGVAAVVLAEESAGAASDVRPVEAVILPPDCDASAPRLLTEGFTADRVDLDAAYDAVLGVLGPAGWLRLVVLWVALGVRPYGRRVRGILVGGWVAVALTLAYLLLGPDPRAMLRPVFGALLAGWGILAGTAVLVAGVQVVRAWRLARRWGAALRGGQARVRMDGGLTLVGGSAGLAFALALIAALGRQDRQRRGGARDSWIWGRVLGALREGEGMIAATGVVRSGGRIDPVVLSPKVAACLLHDGVSRLLTPWQRLPATEDGAAVRSGELGRTIRPRPTLPSPGRRLGFAAERSPLRSYRCRHLADALLAVGLFDRRQSVFNLGTLAVSLVMLAGLPDLRDVLVPPPAPELVGPTTTSPYSLFLSLATQHPDAYQVRFESGFWANRRAQVVKDAGRADLGQAEIRLHRLSRPVEGDPQHGVVWVERRRSFLVREFLPGERVGRYTFAFVSTRPHE